MTTSLKLPRRNRYKDSPLFQADADHIIFGLFEPPPEFDPNQEGEYQHTVSQAEIGFFDIIAVRYYGPGNEALWWGIMLVNGLYDSEIQLEPGDRIRIPPRAEVQRFTSRAGRGSKN